MLRSSHSRVARTSPHNLRIGQGLPPQRAPRSSRLCKAPTSAFVNAVPPQRANYSIYYSFSCTLSPDPIPVHRLWTETTTRPPRYSRTFLQDKMSLNIPAGVRALRLAEFSFHFPVCFSVQRLHSFTPRSDISSIRSISSRTYFFIRIEPKFVFDQFHPECSFVAAFGALPDRYGCACLT